MNKSLKFVPNLTKNDYCYEELEHSEGVFSQYIQEYWRNIGSYNGENSYVDGEVSMRYGLINMEMIALSIDLNNKNLLIIGAGGHGRVVKETAEAMGVFNKIDFLDDNSEVAIGLCGDYEKYKNDYKFAFVALGNPEMRSKWIDSLTEVGYKIPTIIHPTAYASPSAKVGTGSFVGAKAIINTNAVIEQGCIIGIGASIDHDSKVSQYSYVNAGGIVKAGCRVESFKKVDAGMVYSGA